MNNLKSFIKNSLLRLEMEIIPTSAEIFPEQLWE